MDNDTPYYYDTDTYCNTSMHVSNNLPVCLPQKSIVNSPSIQQQAQLFLEHKFGINTV